MLFLSHKFKAAHLITPIVFTDELPWTSRDRAPTLPLVRQQDAGRGSASRGHAFDFARLIPADVETHLLPPPYDTRCVYLDDASVNRTQCLVQGLQPVQRVPFTELLTEPSDLRPVSTKDLVHPSLGPVIRSVSDACLRRFSPKTCYSYTTATQASLATIRYSSLGFALMTPTLAQAVVRTQATMYFVEFFSLICSCFSTWFGISFLSVRTFLRTTRLRV